MNQQTIDLLKIITNIILVIVLIVAMVYTIIYRADVQEAIGSKTPDHLLELYEGRTGLTCSCADLSGFETKKFNSTRLEK